MKLASLAAITTFTLLGTPAATLAQDPAVDAYGGQGAPVLGVTENNSPAVLGETDSNPPTGGAPQADVNGAGNAGPAGTPDASGSAPVAQVTATESAPAGSLPFTGLDLGLIALGGALLIAVGIGARHLSRPVVS